jgi:hypothetical protein
LVDGERGKEPLVALSATATSLRVQDGLFTYEATDARTLHDQASHTTRPLTKHLATVISQLLLPVVTYARNIGFQTSCTVTVCVL